MVRIVRFRILLIKACYYKVDTKTRRIADGCIKRPLKRTEESQEPVRQPARLGHRLISGRKILLAVKRWAAVAPSARPSNWKLIPNCATCWGTVHIVRHTEGGWASRNGGVKGLRAATLLGSAFKVVFSNSSSKPIYWGEFELPGPEHQFYTLNHSIFPTTFTSICYAFSEGPEGLVRIFFS